MKIPRPTALIRMERNSQPASSDIEPSRVGVSRLDAAAVVEHQDGEQHGQVRQGEEELVAGPPLARVGPQTADAVPEEKEAGEQRGGEVEAAPDPQRDE